MSRAWNLVSGPGACPGQRIRKTFDGIVLGSLPRKGYEGYWQSLNGRVSVRKKITGRRHHTPWSVYIDGKPVGNNQLSNLKECVAANDWAIRRAM